MRKIKLTNGKQNVEVFPHDEPTFLNAGYKRVEAKKPAQKEAEKPSKKEDK